MKRHQRGARHSVRMVMRLQPPELLEAADHRAEIVDPRLIRHVLRRLRWDPSRSAAPAAGAMPVASAAGVGPRRPPVHTKPASRSAAGTSSAEPFVTHYQPWSATCVARLPSRAIAVLLGRMTRSADTYENGSVEGNPFYCLCCIRTMCFYCLFYGCGTYLVMNMSQVTRELS